mgnify:FL=1|jgi:hypothetical protein
MRVYHTSDTVIAHPDVLHSRDALDFGKGFYVTLIREQAVKYGRRFTIRGQQAVLNTYELDDKWRCEHIKCFPTYDGEWLDFIVANRKLMPVIPYDAVEGGIANDKIFRTLDLYLAGEIGRDEALKRLKYEKPNHQICILSQELIDKYLTFISSEEITNG